MKTNTKKKGNPAKKLIPAAGSLMVSAVMLATSTYAWFTLNKEVSVTGMQVNTTVGSNLLISHDTTSDTTANADTTFKTIDAEVISGKLEPVSTVNGTSFFYTDSNNVQGNGDAMSDTYVVYNPSSTDAFNTNYGTSGAVGYLDYAFELKANNTTGNTQYINVTDLELTYGGTSSDKAFRVAYFVEDLGTAHSGGTGAPGSLVTILKESTTGNFTSNQAVDSTSTLGAVTYGTAAKLAEVAQGTTHYYKVVARLWIEGEDTTCNNTVFNTLTGKWGLNMTIKLEDSTGGVTALTLDYGTINLSADTASATTLVIDGTTYYQLTTNTGYYTTDSTLTSTSRVFEKTTGNKMYDITNKCTLPAGS
jgi:hypothetical protein